MPDNNFPSDTFTENDVLNCLQQAGLEFKNGPRYILSQCPTHDDQHPSVQIYKDDWFLNCHAGCGRYHIAKAFPSLRGNQQHSNLQPGTRAAQGSRSSADLQVAKNMTEAPKYKQFDLMEDWRKMPLIPRDHVFKGIPLETLDSLGWRWDAAMQSYFIPYFSASKQSVPFAQWRHLNGDRRFTMLKDAKPTCYGTWNLNNPKLFVVEGTSDCAVLEYCGIPWIGLPSASSGELMRAMATYCLAQGIELVYAGDKDAAGDKLKVILEEVMPYRVKQAPKNYKDWGDFFEAEGAEAVYHYAKQELFPEGPAYELTDIEKLQEIIPGAELVHEAGSEPSKEQVAEPAKLF